MTDLYRPTKTYTRNDITQEPGDVPMVEVLDGPMVVAILRPDEFEEQYELVTEDDSPAS